MPRMLVVDGPEKSGKSTIIEAVIERLLAAGYQILTHHWNSQVVNHWQHKYVLTNQYHSAQMLELQSGKPVLILWNRSQASEVIYSSLLARGGDLVKNPLLGEFTYGRTQLTLGPRVILLGPDVATLARLRDHTDLPVDPAAEREAYRRYGETYRWTVLENEHSARYVTELADSLTAQIQAWPEIDIFNYAGAPNATTIFLKAPSQMDWIPFSQGAPLKRLLGAGPRILDYGYATLNCPRERLLSAQQIVIPDKSTALVNHARYYLGFEKERVKQFSALI